MGAASGFPAKEQTGNFSEDERSFMNHAVKDYAMD